MTCSILSLHSASTVATAVPKSLAALAPDARAKPEPLARTMLSASQYGLDKPLIVEAASQSRQFLAMAAAGDAGPIEPLNAVSAARSFVDDLFRRGRVYYAGVGRPEARIEHGRRLRSHQLVEETDGIRLERRLFDCGLCHH
jgi:hypothetical protein